MKYTALEIQQHAVSRNRPGSDDWIPARPLMYWSLRRFKLAWYVLIGKYDALDWEDGE